MLGGLGVPLDISGEDMLSKVLITGFEVFGTHQTNISEQMVSRLCRDGEHLQHREGLVLSVDENGSCMVPQMLSTRLEADELPDAVVMLGLHERADIIHIERRANNHVAFRMPDNSGRVVEGLLIEGASNYLASTAPLAALEQLCSREKNATMSDDCGSYVCNESYFRALDFLHRERISSPLVFVHLPSEDMLGVDRTEQILENIIAVMTSIQ
jgi:pyroglutamyl-peptidase